MTTKNNRRIHICGFTLLELMVTLAVAAILISIAIPSFTVLIRNNSAQSIQSDLVGALQFARTEALSQKQRVSVCASSDQTTCSGSKNWSNGWIVFVDGSSGATVTVDEILKRYSVSSNFTINFGSDGSASVDTFFRYMGTGMLDTEIDAGTFSFCDPDGHATNRSVHINIGSGSVRNGTEAEADC